MACNSFPTASDTKIWDANTAFGDIHSAEAGDVDSHSAGIPGGVAGRHCVGTLEVIFLLFEME